jgi:hypothetical protein
MGIFILGLATVTFKTSSAETLSSTGHGDQISPLSFTFSNQTNSNQTNPSAPSTTVPYLEGINDAVISNVITRDYGLNDTFSIVFIQYNGNLQINHIVLSQTNSSVQTLYSRISPKWQNLIADNSVICNTNSTDAWIKGKTLAIEVFTDLDTPQFELGSLGHRSFS